MAGASLGATAGSSADRVGDDELARAYADETRLRFAFAQHAEGLRQTLVDEGFVAEDFDFWSLRFDIDEDVEGLDPTTDDRAAGVSTLLDHGEPTAFGMVSTSSEPTRFRCTSSPTATRPTRWSNPRTATSGSS
ncbi:hypothetical protein BRD15_00135 [Halobacteriales archaeon SW_6_65_15]|jgi:hypothetical protein|nr:MAG: hypothetical protein BRD15_00135 [Halobacteriales archaeon SW_6_65_15]